MGWYKNQQARYEAKKAGLPRPRTGGIGDKISDSLEEFVDYSAGKRDEAASKRDDMKVQKADAKIEKEAATLARKMKIERRAAELSEQ